MNTQPPPKKCCIFRVPESLAEVNKEAYKPQIVSIGPYHHGSKGLEMIQQHKWRFLCDVIARTGKPLDVFINILVSMEKDIRESYSSESIDHFSTGELAQMMLLDGFFLIELLRKVTHPSDDPIFQALWVPTVLKRDLLRLENQIPFDVLKTLYNESNPDTPPPRTLQSLILEFFGDYVADWQPKALNECANLDGKHLLDFFRQSFIHANLKLKLKLKHTLVVSKPTASTSLQLIRPATKLATYGVKIKANQQPHPLSDMQFQNGQLLLPPTKINAFYASFFMNSVAFEHSNCRPHCSKDITAYVVFMGCLLTTSADVSLLSQNKIIENFFGTDKQVAKFFNSVAKCVPFDDIRKSYLSGLFLEVNGYCNNRWPQFYFEIPSNFILLSLVIALQTFCTLLRYLH